MDPRVAASFALFAAWAAAGISLAACSKVGTDSLPGTMSAPSLDNNPQFDMVLTNPRPILSANNAVGMQGKYTLTYQISADPEFSEGKTINYAGIEPGHHLSAKQIEKDDALDDGTYYWRARSVDSNGNASPWAQIRFHVDLTSSKSYSGYQRAQVADVRASGGQDPKNIIDWSDQGQITYWNNEPRAAGETFSWVVLDMGKPTPVSRFWMLSTRSTTLAPGWLDHFVWQASDDGKSWTDISGTETKSNDTYRNIIDFAPVGKRYYRLVIYSQNALQAQINEIIPYVKAKPPVPQVPDGEYVLIVGNQMNGFTYTQLAKFVEGHGYASVTVPHQEISLDVLRALPNAPMAIIFSGNNADWQFLPLFEYYGEWEIIRELDDIPMMGICAGNEFFAMAYGVSFAHWMSWFDDTMFRVSKGQTPEKVEILPKFVDDPIYDGVPNPFRAVEIHSWAIHPLFLEDERYEEWELMAKTSYVQSIRSKKRPAFSEQFHGEVINEYNQGNLYLANFLEVAKAYRADD